MKILRPFFLITDIGFIVYWLVTLLQLIPESWAFSDYSNPILVDWNWSFFPLDMCVAVTGLLSIYFYSKKNFIWRKLAIISLVLTFSTGLQAISFWTLRSDFDAAWWIMNLFLLIHPIFFIIKFDKLK